MKTKNKTTRFNPFKTFRKNHPFNSFLSICLALAILNLTNSCAFYKVKDLTTSSEEFDEQITQFNKAGYYAIIHSDDNVFHLKHLNIDHENKTISGISEDLSPQHQYKNVRKEKGPNQFKPKKQYALSEIHINIKSIISPDMGKQITIPMTDIHSVSVNKRDGLAEFAVIMLGVAAFLGIVVLIILATKSSCPFVYVKHGDTFQFAGELYPGVLTENMQRDDFLPLGYYNDDRENYTLKVTNELKEIQHTDVLELIVVDHPQDTKVLLDEDGNLHSFSNLVNANTVWIDNLEQNTSTINIKDGDYFGFNTITEDNDDQRDMILEFDSPNIAKEAKLYLTAKNSMWLDYIYGKFNEQFGTQYQKFQSVQQKAKKEQSEKWINEQHIPLSVYVETSNGWELITTINTVGPLAYRDIVVPIDSKYTTNDKLKVKLETGFMFWEVDYAAIDFTENLPLAVNYIAPKEAIDQNNLDVTKFLKNKDEMYLTQSEIGEEVTVTFDLNEVGLSDTHSVFLKNRGYYNYIRDFSGNPNIEGLKVFKEKGSFTNFSRLEYYNILGIKHEDIKIYENE